MQQYIYGKGAIIIWKCNNKYRKCSNYLLGLQQLKKGNAAINCGGCSSKKLVMQQEI
jgi:hypothetical protein